MKPGFFMVLATVGLLTQAAVAAPAAQTAPAPVVTAASSQAASTPVASAPAAGSSAASTPATVPAATPAPPITLAPATPMPMTMPLPSASASAGSLLQTVLALAFVLALLAGLAWFLKRYGPKPGGANNALRVVSSLSLGGRERVVLIEVADQWIVVGASPGRINALATMPRQQPASGSGPDMAQQNGLAAANFSEWLKQTIDKRNGK
jgi:flagellar protein FliO/FliZ